MQQDKLLFVLVVITALAVHALVVALAALNNLGEALSSPYFKNLETKPTLPCHSTHLPT